MRCYLWSLAVLSLFVFSGCSQPEPIRTGPAVEVVVDGDGVFPEFLVGRWKSDDHGWEITFDRDGRISLVRMSFGGFEVTPGKATVVAMKGDGQSVLEPGTWYVEYHKESRELAVEIVIDSFRIEIGTGVVRGSSIDQLVGTVSEDEGLWHASWSSYPTYIVDTEKFSGKQLDTNPADTPEMQLKFIKMSDTNTNDI